MIASHPHRRFLHALAAVLLLLTLLSPALHAQPTIKLATLAPEGTSFHRILLEMGEQWKKSPDQGVKLRIYPGGQMGGESEVIKKMRVGQLQAAMLTVVGLTDIEPTMSAMQYMPMMFDSLEEVEHVCQALQEDMERKFLDKGFVLLFWGDAGWVRFFTTKPVHTPEDLRKLKIFAWAGEAEYIDMLRSMRYTPVPLEPTDILTGLKTGLVESVTTTPSYALAGQFYSPAPYMLELNWAPLVGGTVVTKKAWDQLTPAAQASLREAAKKAGQQIREASRRESNEAVQAMVKRGLKIQKPSPQDMQAWRQLSEELQPRIRGKLVPAAMFDHVRDILRKQRQSKAASP